MQGVFIVRVAAIAALVVALAAVLVTTTGGGGYEIKANFRDASQLVKGGLVQVGGRPVGSIDDISLSDNGLAQVTLKLSDDSITPLRRGTKAEIRALGLSGIANRFVDLEPGPDSGEEIDDGGELGLTETRAEVDLDALLSSLDPGTRDHLQSLIRNGGDLFADDAAKDVNRALKYFNPALAQSRLLLDELTRDREALATLLRSGATVSGVLADQREDLRSSMSGVAGTLESIAAEQDTLSSILDRAPVSARRMTTSLNRFAGTLERVQPALRELSAATPSLASTIRELRPTARAARPVLRQLRRSLPGLDRALRKLPAVAAVAVPALRSTTSAVTEGLPIFAGLRPYTPELVQGLGKGFAGYAANTYDANGHAARIALSVGGAGTQGLLSFGGTDVATLTPQTGIRARCPGAGSVQLSDGSNPFVEAPESCNPKQVRP